MALNRRVELQSLLEELLGSRSVYFQPPENVKMKYPAIVYELDLIRADHADNRPYILRDRYQVTVIDRDPESDIPSKVAELPKCSFSNAFASEGLNHYIFALYF